MSLQDLIILSDKCEKLEAENAKLRKCVEFYADLDNWSSNNNFNDEINDDDCELFKTNEKIIKKYFGGKLARQCLKELDEKL